MISKETRKDLCENCYNPDCIYSVASGGFNED